MRKRHHSLLRESVFRNLRWRFRVSGVDDASGGPASTPASTPSPDIPPVNDGPDRDFQSLSTGEVELPANTPASGAGGGAAARTPADPNQLAGVTQPAANAGEWTSVLEAARARGVQFDATVVDDESAFEFLLKLAAQSRQNDIYGQLGRQLAPQADRIRQFLGQPNGQQVPQPAQPQRKSWEAPEFNPQWLQLVEQHPGTGLFVAKPGVRPEIADSVNAFAEWKAKFDQNPAAVLNAQIEERAAAIADQKFNERFAARERESQIQSIVQENSRFLFQIDQQGQRVLDYTGQPIVTPLGAAYLQQLKVVTDAGVTDPRLADTLAKNLVRGQHALGQLSQGQQQQQQAIDPATQQSFQAPNRNASQANPSQQRRVDPAATDPDEAGLTLSQRLERALQANGITSADIAASVGSV